MHYSVVISRYKDIVFIDVFVDNLYTSRKASITIL